MMKLHNPEQNLSRFSSYIYMLYKEPLKAMWFQCCLQLALWLSTEDE